MPWQLAHLLKGCLYNKQSQKKAGTSLAGAGGRVLLSFRTKAAFPSARVCRFVNRLLRPEVLLRCRLLSFHSVHCVLLGRNRLLRPEALLPCRLLGCSSRFPRNWGEVSDADTQFGMSALKDCEIICRGWGICPLSLAKCCDWLTAYLGCRVKSQTFPKWTKEKSKTQNSKRDVFNKC